jgi:hypothetical protein
MLVFFIGIFPFCFIIYTYDGIVCGFCLPYLSQDECLQLMKDSYHLLNENGMIYLSFVEGY